MELKIYDRQGLVKMTASPDNTSQWNHEVGVENVITVNFTTWEFLVMEVGWYIQVEGQMFRIKNEYRPKHIHDSKYTYNLRFYGREHDTEDILFCRLNQGEDDLESVFAYDGTPLDLLQKVVDNLNRNSDGILWKIGECITDNRKTINFNGLYCWGALGEIARSFNTEWWVDGEYVNLSKCMRGETVSLGYGQGLKSGLVQNENTNAIKWFTRLIPVGSSRNIDRAKYGFSNLQLPGREKYIDVNTQYGLKEYRETAAFSGIYPHRIGYVSSIRFEIRTNEDTGNYTVYFIKDDTLPFNPNDYMISGEVIHMTFNSGNLSGKEFEVNWNEKTEEFEIINQYPDEDSQLPGGNLIPSVGDAYVLTNISMPDEYNTAAELEYQEAVDAYLAEYSEDVSIYSGNTDYIYIGKNNVPLLLGQRVRLLSDRYFSEGSRVSRITRVSRKLNNINEASIDCCNAVSSSWKSNVDSSLNQLQFSAAKVIKDIMLNILKVGDNAKPSDSNVFSALRTLKSFISKEKEDKTDYLLSLLGGAIIKEWAKFGDFVTGIQGGYIDEKGDAELNSLVLRDSLSVPEVRFNRFTYFEGYNLISPGGGLLVADVMQLADGSYQITPELEDGEPCGQYVDDILLGYWHNENADSDFVGFEKMQFRVISVDYDTRTFTIVPKPGTSPVPVRNLRLGQTGNFTNTSRQTYIIIDVRDGNCCITYFDNANTWDPEPAQQKSWIGKKKGMTVAGINCDNYSAVLQNILMTGRIFQIDEITGNNVRVPIDKGKWKGGEHGYYDRVSHIGCLWLCVNDKGTMEEPSDSSSDWLKQVEKGAGMQSQGEWRAEKTPLAANTIMTFAGGAFISKKETSLPPIACWKIDEYTYAMTEEGAYVLMGDWNSYGHKDDWEVLFDIGTIVNGKDGTSIIFKGSYSVHPTTPKEGWAYYNTTDKCSYVYQSGSWQVMVRDGSDGKDYEWIYTRTTVEEAPPQPYSDPDIDEYIPQGWTDDPVSINDEYRYEWACKRTKRAGKWGDFSTVALTYRYADKGADGKDGIDGKDGKSLTPLGDWNESIIPVPAGGVVTFAGATYVAKEETSLPPVAIWKITGDTYARTATGSYAVMGDWNSYGHTGQWQRLVKDGEKAVSYWIDVPITAIHFTATGSPSPSSFLATCKKSVGNYVQESSELYLAVKRLKDNVWSTAVAATKSKSISVAAVAGYTQFLIRGYKTISDANSWNNNFVAEKGVTVVTDGAKGDTGATGSFPYDCGIFTSGSVYVWNSTKRDKVIYPFDGVYYNFLVKNYGSEVTAAPTSATGDSNWEAMNKFVNIATDTLFADGANVANFMFRNGVMRSQAETDGVANMILNGKTGYFHCINADISGVVNATSGTFNNVTFASGTLAGFKVSGNSIMTESGAYDGGSGVNGFGASKFFLHANGADSAFIGFSATNKWVGIGLNTMPVTAGVQAMGRFEDTASEGLTFTKIGLYISVAGASTYDSANMLGNCALYIPKGHIAGFRRRLRRLATSTTLTLMDSTVICVHTGKITITLPADAEDGQEYWLTSANNNVMSVAVESSQHSIYPSDKTSFNDSSWHIYIFDAYNKKWRYGNLNK